MKKSSLGLEHVYITTHGVCDPSAPACAKEGDDHGCGKNPSSDCLFKGFAADTAMGGGLARLFGALPYVQHVIPKAVAKVYPEGSSCISPTTAPSGGMPLGSLPYEKPTIIIHGVDTAYPELHDVAITHVMASPPMQVTVSVGKLAKAIIRVAREARVAPMAMGTHGRTGWRHLLRDRMAGAELHHVPCPMVTASTVVHGVA